jgi:regulator of protease activity HflC (stomatin/prohibitin superfamily)
MLPHPRTTLVVSLIVLLVVWCVWKKLIQKVVVTEFQKGLLYHNGVFKQVLEPGAYRILRCWQTVTLVDARKASVTIAGQEIITADNVGLKLSLLLGYQIVDPAKAINTIQSWYTELYAVAQLVSRDVLSGLKVDEILEKRISLGDQLLELVKPKAQDLGIEVHMVQIKDLMFPADLRKAYGDIIRAQKEGQAALERARGEQAALRSLANAARMLEGNPALMNLRVLQTLSGQAGSPPPTVVLGVPNGLVPLQAGARASGSETQES